MMKNNILIHKLSGNTGEFIKEYQPTGKPLTTQIRLDDNRIYFAPSHEFVRVQRVKESLMSSEKLTDLDRFIELYQYFGIELKTKKEYDKIKICLEGDKDYSTHSDKFKGYPSFFSEIEFTLDGNFIAQGFWE